MNLGEFVNQILGIEKKYESVDAEYLGNGVFTLSVERDSRKVIYNSQETYSITSTSPFLSLFSKRLGGPMEEERIAPSMTIEDNEKKETAYILYDKEHGTIFVRIQKENQIPLQIQKDGGQVLCSDSSMSDETASVIASNYVNIFRRQQKLLDIKTHEKRALEITIQQYSVIGS